MLNIIDKLTTKSIEAIKRECKVSHTSAAKGYVSRRNPEGIAFEYNGKFGKGYKIYTPRWDTTNYCWVTYYIERGE